MLTNTAKAGVTLRVALLFGRCCSSDIAFVDTRALINSSLVDNIPSFNSLLREHTLTHYLVKFNNLRVSSRFFSHFIFLSEKKKKKIKDTNQFAFACATKGNTPITNHIDGIPDVRACNAGNRRERARGYRKKRLDSV